MNQTEYVLGLDMGGTNSVLGLVDAKGNVLARTAIKTQDYPDINNYISALYEAAKKIVPNGDFSLCKGIGAGVPNGNFYTGNIEGAVNIPWHGIVPFSYLMSQRFGIPCHITNDANAAAMGEMMYGVAQGMKNFIMVTLGTGVGSGIVIDGKVVYGHDGFAGELGHVCMDYSEQARQCNCGNKGCLETYASASGVARTAQEIIRTSTKDTILRSIDPLSITSKDVFDAAEQGDQVAQEIFDFTGTILGRALANAVDFSAPEAIVLFGGLAKSGHWIMEPFERALNKHVLKTWRNKVKVLISGLKEADAAVVGASALAWE